MQLSDAVIIALASSPTILAIVNSLLTRKPRAEQLKKIEEISQSLNSYKIEQAIQSFSQKNWRIIEKKNASPYDIQEWYMLYNSIARLLPENKWNDGLKSETKRARIIVEGA